MSDPSMQLETMKQQVLRMNAIQRKVFVNKLKENPALAQQANQFLGPTVLQFIYQDEDPNLPTSSNNNPVATFNTNNRLIRKGRGRPPHVFQTTRTVNEARRNLQQLQVNQLLKIPYSKPVVNGINFIPRFDKNFCYLVGLDLVVQQVREDGNVFGKYEEKPYVCEKCGTDFTPSWKAIGHDVNHLHLSCEKCFRQSQKKKVIAHHTAVFKRAFSRNANEVMELEKEIAAGKFNKNDHPPVSVSQEAKAGPSYVPIAPKPPTIQATIKPLTVSLKQRWTSLKF